MKKYLKITLTLALFFSFLNMQNLAYVQAGAGFGSGPGGVDSTDGTSNLILWLDANDIAGNDHSHVGLWNDKSGWDNDALQTNEDNQPTLETYELNNQSVVRFDGILDHALGDWLKIADSDELDGTAGLTIFLVINPELIDYRVRGILSKRDYWFENASYTIFFYDELCLEDNCILFDIDNNETVNNRFTSDPYTFTTNIPSQIAVWYDGSQLTSKLMVNATNVVTVSVSSPFIPNYVSDLTLGIQNEGYDQVTNNPQYYQGDIAEAIIFRKALNRVELLLVENYLSSKYNLNIDSSGLDRYQGDMPCNGDFDLDVAGIGIEADGLNTTASSAGMTVKNKSFLADHGDYLLFGHRSTMNSLTTDDLPWSLNTNPEARRWSRNWFVDITNSDTSSCDLVDISFDYSDAGLEGFPINDASDYKLLSRAETSEAFGILDYSAVISGDKVIFNDVEISNLGNYITLGTIDSQLSSTYFTLNINKDGSGNGVVSTIPGGINCGLDCSEDYIFNTVITLTQTAEINSIFRGWSGDCTGFDDCIISMDGHKSVTATYVVDTYYYYIPFVYRLSTSNE